MSSSSIVSGSKSLKVVYDYELNRFTNVTTFHGLIRLYQGRRMTRVFWTIVLFFALGCFLLQCINSVSYLLSKPTVSQINLIVPENGVEFPALTICNYNPVKRSIVAAYNISDSVLEYILTSFLQVEDIHVQFSNVELALMKREYKLFLLNSPDFSLDKFVMDAGYSCEDMFLQCSFAGRPVNCCDLAIPILTDMGKCFQFQSYSNRSALNRQYIAGPYYGFQAFVNARLDEYPQVFMGSYYESGIRIFVHPVGELPYLSSGGQSASPGQLMYASISQVHHILLPPEQWGQCKKSWDTDENLPYMYTSSLCQAKCIATNFYDKCNCVPLRYKLASSMIAKMLQTFANLTGNVHSDVPICDPMEMYNCTQSNQWPDDQSFWNKKCSCGAECDRWNYDISTSYVSIPSPGSVKGLEKRLQMSESDMRQNLIILNAYLNQVNYVEYVQLQATSLTTTLSNIGGNMGMFIGASIVTCFEIIVFMMKICWDSCSKKRREVLFEKQINEIQSSVPSFYGSYSSRNGDFDDNLSVVDETLKRMKHINSCPSLTNMYSFDDVTDSKAASLSSKADNSSNHLEFSIWI